jgi:hypothetical protein
MPSWRPERGRRHGCIPTTYVLRQAKLAGISERTLRRAKFKLGVIARVWPYDKNRWAWELPKAAAAAQAPG